MMKRLTSFLAAVAMILPGIGAARSEVWFTSPDLRSAAADLGDFLSRKGGGDPQEHLASSTAKFQRGDWVVANLSKDRGGTIAGLLTPEGRASLESENREGFIARNSEGTFYLIGGAQRGAIYACSRLQTLWEETGENPLAEDGASLRGAPIFTIRVGGAGGPNGETDFPQPFPADYDWDAYARDLAHLGVNLTAGVLGGEVVPDEPLMAWGIRKILFVSANPFPESELRTWRSSDREDLKPTQNTRSIGDDLKWGPCLSGDFGKKVYRDWLTELSTEHRTAAAVVFYFSDWGSAPGEECRPGASLSERVTAFLKEIDTIARSVAPEVKVYASTRGFSLEDLAKIVADRPPRVGIYFEEPSTSLLDDPSAGYDPSLAASELAPAFAEIYRNTLQSKPNDTIAAIAAGDSGWLVSPAVGAPLPQTAYRKLHAAHDLGARNVALAMGGLHPWVYSPATEVVKEVFWNREESYDDLAARIASRDFGSLSDDVLSAWSLFDEAMERMPSLSRVQGLHRFVGSTNHSLTEAVGVVGLEERHWPGAILASVPFLLESLPASIDAWRRGVEELQGAQDLLGENSYETARRLRDSLFWSTFYLRLLEAQNNAIRLLNLLSWASDGEDPTKDPWRQAFLPIYRDEVANAQGWVDLLFTAPYARIRVEKEVTTPAAFSRKMQQKQTALRRLIGDR